MPQAEFDSIRTLRTLAHLGALGNMEYGVAAAERSSAREDSAVLEDQIDVADETAKSHGNISRSKYT